MFLHSSATTGGMEESLKKEQKTEAKGQVQLLEQRVSRPSELTTFMKQSKSFICVKTCVCMCIFDYLNSSGSASAVEQSLKEEWERKIEAKRVQLLTKKTFGELSTVVFACFVSTN